MATLVSTGCTGAISWEGNGVSIGGPTPSIGFQTPSGVQTPTLIPFKITCTESSSVASTTATITVVPVPSLTITASAATTVSEGSTVTLTAAGCDYGTMHWSTGTADNGRTQIVVLPLQTTTYSATCTVGDNCQATASRTVTVQPVPKLSLITMVSKARARIGDVLTYTVIVSNTGNAAANNVVVEEYISAKANYIPNSATASTGTFTAGIPTNTWAFATLPANASATLTYSASVVGEGVVNVTSTIQNVDTTQVCTSIPILVCPGSGYVVQVNAPAGYSNYKFYNGTALVQEGPLNSYTATTAGEYKVLVDDGTGVCQQQSCCPLVIEDVPVSLTLTSATGSTLASGSSTTLLANGCQSGTVAWSNSLTGVSQVVSPTVTTAYSATCTTPEGCTASVSMSLSVLGPQVSVQKFVSATKAQLGSLVTFTVVVANTGPVAASAVAVRDSVGGGVIVPGSVNVSQGAFSPNSLTSLWNVGTLPASSTATLVYSVSIVNEGVVYASANAGGQVSQVCLSVPVNVCPGDPVMIELTAPAGYTRYEWYRGTEKVYDGLLTSFTATALGEYRVIGYKGNVQCPDLTCCPIFIESDSIPLYDVVATRPTCLTNQPQANGSLRLSGLGSNTGQFMYQYSEGTSFNAAAALQPAPVPVPAGGVIASTLNQAKTYTVRVFNALGCFRDVTVTLSVSCDCPPNLCVPVAIRKTKTRP
ncbi:DUF11 domain-containing protein [Arsenicibacter rosenii]|nr:DUF11 domain-containing protein [Arsenicibacter rosenii]